MGRLWRNINRDLVPRRYTDVVIGLWLLAFAGYQAARMSHAPPTVSRANWAWAAAWGVFACYMLAKGVAGVAAHHRLRSRARRQVLGRCVRCGYDLHAALSVNCPECGAYHGSTPGKRSARGSPGAG